MIAVLGAGAFGTALAVAEAAEGRQVRLWGRDPAAMAAAERRARTRGCRASAAAAAPLHRRPRGARGRGGRAAGAAGAGDRRRSWPRRRRRCRPRRWCSAPRGSTPARMRRQTEIAAERGAGPRAGGADRPGLRRRDRARPADGADARLRRCRRWGASCRRGWRRGGSRLYLTDDVIGAELGGALKNVDRHRLRHGRGRRLGASARAALMTRGFAEMTRLAVAMGARRRDAGGAVGPRRPVADLQLGAVAQLRARPRARRRRGAGPAAPSRGLRRRAPPASLPARTASSCRSRRRWRTCSTARRSPARWRRCWRGRCGRNRAAQAAARRGDQHVERHHRPGRRA